MNNAVAPHTARLAQEVNLAKADPVEHVRPCTDPACNLFRPFDGPDKPWIFAHVPARRIIPLEFATQDYFVYPQAKKTQQE